MGALVRHSAHSLARVCRVGHTCDGTYCSAQLSRSPCEAFLVYVRPPQHATSSERHSQGPPKRRNVADSAERPEAWMARDDDSVAMSAALAGKSTTPTAGVLAGTSHTAVALLLRRL